MIWGLAAAVVAAAILAVLLLGHLRWRRITGTLRARLADARAPIVPPTVDLSALDDLPAPVARCLRTVLVDGAPRIAGVRVRHRGTFAMGKTMERWCRFRSDQVVVLRRPGFDWDARIEMAPGLVARVHDAYLAGEGILHAALWGLFPVADERGDDTLAEAELLRFLAESPWYPTALLPGQGMSWESIDERSARATLVDGDFAVSLDFTFDDEDRIAAVEGERAMRVGERWVHRRWQGRFWDYQRRGGMLIPLEGEVAWLLPEGHRPYWRGRIEEIELGGAE